MDNNLNASKKKTKKFPKVLIPIIAVVVCIATAVLILYSVLNNSKKQIPVYTGMSVSHKSPEAKSADLGGEIDFVNGGLSTYDVAPDVSGIIEDYYATDTVDVNNETFEVEGSDSVFYAKKNTDVYVTVHVNNPDAFEILSFTLNGQKYSSYMFEPGSDLENLILKVSAEDALGIVEYTIDAIKYIDGTDIKDVRMDGSKTIKVGYPTVQQPIAEVTNEVVDYKSVSLNALVTDTLKLVEKTGGNVKAVICNGDTVVKSVPLTVNADNAIVFDGLDFDTVYAYAIVATYDNLEDHGVKDYIIYEKAVKTKSPLNVLNAELTPNGILYSLEFSNDYSDGKINSIELVKNGEKIKDIGINDNSITGLLSNNLYELVINYTLPDGSSVIKKYTFRTEEIEKPTVEITDINFSETKITFNVSKNDPNGLARISLIELRKNGEKIDSITEGNEFVSTGFDPLANYTLHIDYVFDLGDGNGNIKQSVKVTVINLREMSLLSDHVEVSDTVVVRIKTNDIKGTVKQVKINGVVYDVGDTSTSTNTVVEIKDLSKFDGSNILLTLEELYFEDSVYKFTQNNTARLVIDKPIEIKSFAIVDFRGEPIEYAFRYDTVYYYVELENLSGHKINSITFFEESFPGGDAFGGVFWDGEESKFTDIIMLDDNTLLIKSKLPDAYNPAGQSVKKISLRSIAVASDSGEKVFNVDSSTEIGKPRVFIRFACDDIIEVSTADDLKNMNQCAYYKLINDIDLSSLVWDTPGDFCGYFDGNGHTISGISIVGKKYSNQYLELGLFRFANGIIEDLTIEDMFINIEATDSQTAYGGVAAGSGALILRDVRVLDQSVTVKIAGNYNTDNIHRWIGNGNVTLEGGSTVTGKITVDGKETDSRAEVKDDTLWNYKIELDIDRAVLYEYSFETNGGEALPDVKAFNIGDIVPYRKDYLFLGWYDNPEFEGERIKEYQFTDKNMKLYAKWYYAGADESKGLDYYYPQDDYPHISGIGSFTGTVLVLNKPIAVCAFLGNTTIEKVILGPGVTEIGNSAFSNCTSLKEVVIFGDVAELSGSLFYECTKLETVIINGKITKIGDGVFRRCEALKTISIPNSVTEIGSGAFDGCSALESVNMPSALITIGSAAFQSCEKIKSIEIPNGVTTVGAAAFCGCISLENIVLPKSVKTIGEYAFSNCHMIKSVNIPSGVTEIAQGTFIACEGLEYIEISQGVVKIGQSAFEQCRSLKNIVLPDSVEIIEKYVFCGCYELKSIVMPKDVTYIGEMVFSYLGYESKVYFEGKENEYNVSEWSNKWNSEFNGDIIWGYEG